MAKITILPRLGVIHIGPELVRFLNIPLGDPEAREVVFDTESNKGTIGFLSENGDDIFPTPVEITSLGIWAESVTEAEETIHCRNNPKTYYTTAYPVGAPVLVRERGWPQPPGTANKEPPGDRYEGSELYWDGTGFKWSAFPINLPLAEAQEFLSKRVNARAYGLLQPTDWIIIRRLETEEEMPVSLVEWRAAVREEAKRKATQLAAAEDLESLDTLCRDPEFTTWPAKPQ